MSDLDALITRHDPPCDFLAFVAQRWSKDVGLAADRLGELVLSYEPGPVAQGFAARARSARPHGVCLARRPRHAAEDRLQAEPTDAAA